MNLSDYRNIKIAFFDIDGTMIDIGSRKITPKMLKTLSGLQKNGIRICIATGRPPAILPQFPGIEFDAYLTFNASYCYTKNEVIFRNPIPPPTYRQSSETLRKSRDLWPLPALPAWAQTEATRIWQIILPSPGISWRSLMILTNWPGKRSFRS